MSEYQEITPVPGPVSGRVRPPGSKSITNRALILAALADGHSKLTGVLESTDTRVMIESLNRLGIGVAHDTHTGVCEVDGCGGQVPASDAELWLENSGTSIRFLTALCSLGTGRYRLDGIARMRQRPIADLTDCLATLGATVACEDPATGCPPVVVEPGQPLAGGQAGIRGNISSQFLSALLMSAPCATSPVTLTVDGELVSVPYVDMTLRMMADFGVSVERPDAATFCLPSQPYVPRTYDVEPDASAASYFMGVAAVTGGSVTIEGLTKGALQGDVEFATALEQMGCEVQWHADSVTVTGRPLRGIDIDMNAISDTAQTLSTVAVFADGPTRIRSVEHMRHKETDRVSAVVTELRRAGIAADEFDDGLTIHPGTPQPAEIHTYDDHRMAMSFALLGLKAAGIRILDPGCTAKTYPRFFEDLRLLCGR
ncbi:MAG: 3-phosphoshikimate 1-carboxyvinyltransferase [Planctomycetaceae bacterium]|nr:3-phosphoshikimate 1-carboxyvinyltransferase [Planctomycetaceae bacterium]